MAISQERLITLINIGSTLASSFAALRAIIDQEIALADSGQKNPRDSLADIEALLTRLEPKGHDLAALYAEHGHFTARRKDNDRRARRMRQKRYLDAIAAGRQEPQGPQGQEPQEPPVTAPYPQAAPLSGGRRPEAAPTSVVIIPDPAGLPAGLGPALDEDLDL